MVLELIHAKRIKNLRSLTLTKLLNKNPYLYRAIGVDSHEALISKLIEARISSSDETIFGNEFFEPLALWAAKRANENNEVIKTVTVSGSAGIDICIEDQTAYYAIAVKSGKNIFNVQSGKGQNSEIAELRARIKKIGKQFLPYIGYGYGRKAKPKKATDVEKVAGQKFWSLLTGDEDFYMKICKAMDEIPASLSVEFAAETETKRIDLVEQFKINFPSDNGLIPWESLVAFNSADVKPFTLKKKASRTARKKKKD